MISGKSASTETDLIVNHGEFLPVALVRRRPQP